MIFNLKDLKHLELMAQLDNAEPKLIKKATAPNMQLLPVAKDTLDSKILSLCTQLRAQSFVKQAHALEQRFLRFKTAGTSLYNLSGETGDQLINDAHPEGDVEMVEAADELGVVETILSRHTKIVEMVQGKHLGKKAGTDEEALAKEVASQFDYIADYLKQQFLNNMPEGSTLEPAARNFYGFASGWAEIASSIANKLKNSPSSSYAPMVIVKTMLGEHSFSSSYVPITNTAEDVHRLVEHVLNWFEDNRPKEKTAGLSRYVEKCRKVLAQDVSAKNDNQKLIEEFRVFGKEFGEQINTALVQLIYSNKKIKDFVLPNGKLVGDYFSKSWSFTGPGLDNIPQLVESLANSWEHDNSQGAKIVGIIDNKIKYLFELLWQLNSVMDKPNPPPLPRDFVEKAYKRLNPYREIFLTIYTKVNGDQMAADWHGKFIPGEIIKSQILKNKEKLKTLPIKIDRHVLSSEEVKSKNITLFEWFEKEKIYINDNIIGGLDRLAGLIDKFNSTTEHIKHNRIGQLTMDMIKQFTEKASPALLVTLKEDSFKSKEEFLSKLDQLPSRFDADCLASIQSTKFDNEGVKDLLIEEFSPTNDK